MKRRFRIALVALAAAVAAVLAATGASGHSPHPPANLWATVNVCTSTPARLGVRGRMPGDASAQQMYMRFTAQFHRPTGWAQLAGHGRSPWVSTGSATSQYQEAGWTFDLARPQAGQSYLLRGYVEYEWRAHQHGHTVVVRRAHALTAGGHPGTIGARPHGHSSASCQIKSSS